MAGLPGSVLVIDDDELVLAVVQPALESSGEISTECCLSCDEAIGKLDGFTPNLILLDLHMPGKSGVDTLENLNKVEKLKNIPIIFITANERVKMVEKYKKLGVAGIIYKPFTPMELINKMRMIWQRHQYIENV